MSNIRNSYADKKDDFRSSLRAIPSKTVLEESKRQDRYKEDKKATSETAEERKAAVAEMAAVHDLCDVVVNLVANAKYAKQDTGASMRCQSILNALEEFDRDKCKLGKVHLVYMSVFALERIIQLGAGYI